MEQRALYEEEMDLKEIFALLLRKWKLLLIIAATGVLLAIIFSFISSSLKPPIIYHKATTQVRLVASETKPQQLPAFVELARSKTVAEKSIAKLELKDTPEQFAEYLTVEVVKNTNVIDINVLNQDGVKASKVSDTVRQEAIALANQSMDVGSIESVGDAAVTNNFLTEREPVNHKRNAVIGLFLSLMLGVFFVLAQKYFNNKLQTKEEVEKHLGVSVLACIPCVENGNEALDEGGGIGTWKNLIRKKLAIKR